jgi:hypothetical protein
VEDLVDKKNEPDCLFWKIDFLLSYLPGWMLPAMERQKLSLANLETGSTITGSSTTSETSRGGRKTAILFDEFAAVPEGYSMLSASRDAANCRIFNSTPKGTGNAFYTQREKFWPLGWVLRLHWTIHPKKAKGLYYDEGGKPRSPWYDKQCARASNQTEIAQELDIDYVNSAWQYFETKVVLDLIEKHARKPYMTVSAAALVRHLKLRPDLAAKVRDPLHLWTYHDKQMAFPKDRDYAVACDIATGKDGELSSQSVLSIGDRLTKEKVGMFCARNLYPSELAEVAIAICKWFEGQNGTAFLAWEANGPGGEFGKQVVDKGYLHIYYRHASESTVVRRKTELTGWWSNRESKRLLLSQYATALTTGNFINRSEESLRETLEYVHDPSGEVRHAKQNANRDIDPTSSGENHGDMVIADAILNLILKERPSRQKKTAKRVPPNSYAGRMLERLRSRRRHSADRMFEDHHYAA